MPLLKLKVRQIIKALSYPFIYLLLVFLYLFLLFLRLVIQLGDKIKSVMIKIGKLILFVPLGLLVFLFVLLSLVLIGFTLIGLMVIKYLFLKCKDFFLKPKSTKSK